MEQDDSLAARTLRAHAKTLEKLADAEERIQALERENHILKSLDRIARIVRAAAYWTPEYRKQLVKELQKRFPETKGE